VEQLHKKHEFIEYLFRFSHNSIFFFSNKVRGAETIWLKNVERSSPEYPHNALYFKMDRVVF
jgi:hypothetical protein